MHCESSRGHHLSTINGLRNSPLFATITRFSLTVQTPAAYRLRTRGRKGPPDSRPLTPGLRGRYAEADMGTLRQVGRKWRAEICVKRKRRSKTCRTKAEAMAWIVAAEAEADDRTDKTLADLVTHYVAAHSAHKVRTRQDSQRAHRIADAIGRDLRLSDLTPERLAQWRDERLKKTKPATVRRDWNLLHHMLAVAVRELAWLKTNPLDGVTKPRDSKPRDRVMTDTEIETLIHCTGWPGDTLQARVGAALLFALETGMRAAEICRLRPEHVFATHVHVPETKNGHPRDVPLSAKAREILGAVGNDFGLTTSQLDALFRKARDRAGLVDLHFHDSRRTALTRLSKKLDALELARVSGHRDLRILLQVYYQPSIGDLAAKLEEPKC